MDRRPHARIVFTGIAALVLGWGSASVFAREEACRDYMYVSYEGGPTFGAAQVSVRAPDRELPATPVMASAPAAGAEFQSDDPAL